MKILVVEGNNIERSGIIGRLPNDDTDILGCRDTNQATVHLEAEQFNTVIVGGSTYGDFSEDGALNTAAFLRQLYAEPTKPKVFVLIEPFHDKEALRQAYPGCIVLPKWSVLDGSKSLSL